MADTAPQKAERAAAIEAGRVLFAQECRFVIGAVRDAQLPPPSRTEFAFAGRSNVGKSSLINALTGRKTLARVSNTPGRTQQINFFDLGGRAFLVDLPGYGYARASKTDTAAWNKLIRDYLRGRPTLARVCLLIDARRGLGDVDREITALLDEAAQAYQIVLTKADVVPEPTVAALQRDLARTTAGRGACHPDVAVTSAEKGTGVPELRAALADLVAQRERAPKR